MCVLVHMFFHSMPGPTSFALRKIKINTYCSSSKLLKIFAVKSKFRVPRQMEFHVSAKYCKNYLCSSLTKTIKQ